MGKRSEAHQFQMAARELKLPVFGELYRAVECMAAVLYRKERTGSGSVKYVAAETASISNHLPAMMTATSGIIDEFKSKQILSLCNVPVVEEQIVTEAAEAKRLAGEFGYPVVLKGIMPGKVHKTELDLVRLGVSSANAVETAFMDLQKNMSNNGTVLMQKQAQGYPELIAGLIRDPQFGPCVMCGFGGILAEVIADSVFAAAPLTMEEALNAIGRLKSQKLLNGFRGSQPVNREVLADILVRLGDLGTACEQIKEIDINPLIVNDGIPIAVDATIILDR
jgi:acetyltransferase